MGGKLEVAYVNGSAAAGALTPATAIAMNNTPSGTASQVQNITAIRSEALERVLIGGDLSHLTAEDRVSYYRTVCESLQLNPLTKPFEYITLNGKLVLYAKRDCTDQLRRRDRISIRIASRELVDGVYVVTARAMTPDGREDESTGAVPLEGLKGEAKANAIMKGETKAKRRATLSICGLGLLDETEIESITPAPAVTARQNSREAQQRVAEEKIAELEAQQAARLAETPVQPVAKPWQTRGEMRQVFAMLRENLGETVYNSIMGERKPENLRSPQEAMNLYQRLLMAAQEVQ